MIHDTARIQPLIGPGSPVCNIDQLHFQGILQMCVWVLQTETFLCQVVLRENWWVFC